MRSLVPILLFISIQSFGQEKGSETTNSRIPADSLFLPSLGKMDSLTGLASQPFDSVGELIQIANHKIDSLDMVPGVTEKYTSKINSLEHVTKNKLDSLSALISPGDKLDSINPAQKLNDYAAKLNSLRSKLMSKIDTLSKFLLADSSDSPDLRQLKSKLDSVNVIRPPARKKLDTLRPKISSKADTIQRKINEKLGMFSENGGNLPGEFNLPVVNMRSPVNIDPNIGIPTELPIPDVSIPTVNNPLESMDAPNISSMPESSIKLPEMPDAKINDIKLPEDITTIQDKLSGLSEVEEKIDGYHEDLKSLREGDLSKVQEIPDAIQIANRKFESLNFVPEVMEKYTGKIDSLRGKLLTRIDHLSSLPNPDTLLIKRLSQVNVQLDSLKFQLLTGDSGAVNTVGEVKSRITEPLIKIQEALNEKFNLLSENGVKLPGPVTLPAANLNTHFSIDPDLAIPIELPTIDLKVPTVKNPLDGIDLPGSDLTPEGSVKIPELPTSKINEIKLPEKISGIQDKLSGLSEAEEKIEGYRQDMKEIGEGDLSKVQELPDAIESRVENLDEIKALEKASEEFAAIKAKWNDPQVLKELALNKAKETAVNHFAGHEKELKAAMDKLSKLKAKIPDPEGTIDLFAKRQQFMKGKPVVERLVPGLALQFQKQQSYWLDINPYMGFKISGRWQAGLGWNERLAYHFDERDWDKENRIYGLRSFLHFKLKSNFWLKAEVENMNAPVRATPLMASEIVGRDWIWSYFAGIKKDFQFSKGLKASLQTVYSIYDPDKRSPYTNRLNVRIGFEMAIKQKETGEKKIVW